MSISQSVSQLISWFVNCNFVRSLIVQIVLLGTSVSTLMGTAECAKRFESAAPCLPGEQLRVEFRPWPAIWQLASPRTESQRPCAFRRALQREVEELGGLRSKIASKIKCHSKLRSEPSGSDSGLVFGSLRGPKWRPKWSQIPLRNGFCRRSLKRISFSTNLHRIFNKKH